VNSVERGRILRRRWLAPPHREHAAGNERENDAEGDAGLVRMYVRDLTTVNE